MNTAGFRPRDTTNSVHINARTNDLRSALRDQNEPYRDVTDMYADEMAVRDALEQGQDVAKLSGPEINAQLGDLPGPRRAPQAPGTGLGPYTGSGAPPPPPMPNNAREAWITGARTALADEAVQAGLKPTANVAQRIRQAVGLSGAGLAASAGDPVKRAALEDLSGRSGVLTRLDDRLEAEDQAYETFARAARARPPGPQDDPAFQDAALMLGAVGNAAMGRWRSAAGDLLKGGQQGTLGFRRGVNERTAELLTAPGSSAAQASMEALTRRAVSDDRRRRRIDSAALHIGRTGILSLAAQPMEHASDVDPWDGDRLGVLYPAYRRDLP